MDRLIGLKEAAVVIGVMWFITLPIAVLGGITAIGIVGEVLVRTVPWQSFWETVSAYELFRIFLCGVLSVYGAVFGTKGLLLEFRGEGILELIISQIISRQEYNR
ncbi:MAG: hypothetical protein KZQ97_17005 [Candidatus Thiodiazotropha sp. (ex Dulcina madagascariensis)]|nr:hypothetical protein [Candidatus Thiodiazotropha sp. (ex Dulcina madagascariensis)]